jgi:D-alanyl-D-alanine carboxypeptidase/D-alanyl-D-alanine-endopeptidase (penicillin-binding protein 4)
MTGTKGFSGIKQLLILNYSLLILSSCSVTKQISKSANTAIVNDSSVLNAHLGISIYEPASGKYWYNYNGEKYFVPASNTKIPTCYAAMKYLGDSIPGIRYLPYANEIDTGILIEPTGDPTFLHPDYQEQKVLEFLKRYNYKVGLSMPIFNHLAYASGWSVTDLDANYMPPRTNWPIYGNIARFRVTKDTDYVIPSYYKKKEGVFRVWQKGFIPNVSRNSENTQFIVYADENVKEFNREVPFYLKSDLLVEMIQDTLHKSIYNFRYRHTQYQTVMMYRLNPEMLKEEDFRNLKLQNAKTIFSQPTDSLLKPMMHRSDNFFAEQSLLMVSNEMLGIMNDAKIIDTLLKTDFKDLPQKPRWVDGSGLSRYNLFTPQDFVVILGKMKNEFGMNRIKEIFPTGGEGTISSYYKTENGFIYAKTGTLSGVVALSGFLTTKKNKELIFSVLVNNHHGSATAVRKAVEKFIKSVREKY